MENQDDKNIKNLSTQKKHDTLFRQAYSQKLPAMELLANNLPTEILELVDLEKLVVVNETHFVNNKVQISDLVYRLPTKDNNNIYIITTFEHQSKPDPMMAYRFLKYAIGIWEQYIKDWSSKKLPMSTCRLPLITNILMYNGEVKYNAPLNLADLSQYPELARDMLTRDYKLIDLQYIHDEEIIKRNDKITALVEFMLKHAYDNNQVAVWDMLLNKLAPATKIDVSLGCIYLPMLLCYSNAKDDKEIKQIENLIEEKLGVNIMGAFAEKYIKPAEKKGIEKGIEKEKVSIAVKLIKQRVDKSIIAKATGLTVEELTALKKSLKN